MKEFKKVFLTAGDRIIVAADVSSLKDLKKLVKTLKDHVGMFKIGLELISSVGGPAAVKAVHDAGGEVFYDGKFSDISNTVGAAASAENRLGVYMFNVHANGGMESMKAAVEKSVYFEQESSLCASMTTSLVIAVTVLTSIGDDECKKIYGRGRAEMVKQFTKDALSAGCDGVICSAQELKLFDHSGPFMFVTPGIRPKWAATNDQNPDCIDTPYEAIKNGATMLVIGRPITKPPAGMTMLDAVKKITEEIENGLKDRG